MTQLAEKQKPSLDTLQNDQFELAKLRMLEQHEETPKFTYEQSENDQDSDSLSGNVYLKSGDDEYNAVGFTLDKEGRLMWYDKQEKGVHADKDADAVSIVIARQDGSIERLGMEKPFGSIDNFTAQDQLYILHDSTINLLSDTSELTKRDLNMIIDDKDIATDAIRLSLDDTTGNAPAQQPTVTPTPSNFDSVARRKKEQKEKAQRDEARQASAVTAQPKPGVTSLTARMKAVADANKATLASMASSDPASLAVMSGIDSVPVTPAPVAVTAPGSSNPDKSGGNTASQPERARGWSKEQTAEIDKIRARRQASNSNVASQALPAAPDARNTADTSTNPDAEPVDPVIERARKQLDALRGEMATVAGKRQGRLFNFNSKKHAELEERYKQQMATLGKLECHDLLNDDTKTDSEKNVGVIAFIFDEQQKLREATTESLKNSHVSKMINWLHEGTKTQRFLKGAAVGAGGVLIGAGLGAVAGVAAGAGLVAAATVTAKSLTRFGRYYAKADNKAGRGMSTLNAQQESDAKNRAAQAIEQNGEESKFNVAADHFKNMFDADTRKEQEKRRQSTRRAIGGVAVGMLVGGAAAYAIGELIDGGKLGDFANRNLGGEQVEAKPVEAPSSNHDIDPTDNGNGAPAPKPELPPQVVEHDFSPAAETINLGEGWLQTFNEAGIADVNQQYALLNNQALMQELANKGLAYRDANIGGWGINMTTDGKMPADALKLIESYANRNGYNLAS
jgi:hypothetical protein